MIELRSGVPGSGKTLSMVLELSKLLDSWGKNPEQGRPIFVHNIKDLALPHAVLPLREASFGNRTQSIPDWDAVPEGSLIIIDECQDLFPPRSSQSAAPAHISWFNTHRHKGIDLWLTTQHPKLLDFSVRALVGKHIHFRRLFGGQRSATYEWDSCSDSLGGMKDSVISFFAFPKKIYKFYNSAQIHTKQSFRLPRWLIIPLLGVAVGVYAFPKAYTSLTTAVSGQGLSGVKSEKPAQPPAQVAALPPLPVASLPPASLALPLPTAARFDSHDALEPLPDVLAGCARVLTLCRCYTVTAKLIDKPASFCESETTVPPVPISPGALAHVPDRADVPEVRRDLDLIAWATRNRGDSRIRQTTY